MALHQIKLVGNLSGYRHDTADAERIIEALNDAVKEVEVKFRARQRDDERSFSL